MSMKLLSKLSVFFDRTLDFLYLLTAIFIAFVALSIGLEVFMRYFLEHPLFWVVEISEYSLLYITFLGTAWLLRKEGHVSMDFVVNRLNPRKAALLNIITSILGTIVCLFLIWYGTQITWFNFERGVYLSTLIQPSKAAILVIIPFGSLMLFVQFLRRTYGYLQSWRLSSSNE